MSKSKTYVLLTLLILFVKLPSLYGYTDVAFNQKQYQVRDGLVNNETYCCLKDSKGYMWFGTETGISCFNGSVFKNYRMMDGLTGNSVFRLFEDYKGRLWYTAFNGGIGYIEDGRIMPYEHNQNLIDTLGKGHWVHDLIVKRNGEIYFNSPYSGAGKINVDGEITFDECLDLFSIVHKMNHQKPRHKTKHNFLSEQEHNSLYNALIQAKKSEFTALLGSVAHLNFLVLNDSAFLFMHLHSLGYIDQNSNRMIGLDKTINYMDVDESGELWVSLAYTGVYVYNSVKELFNDKQAEIHFLDGFNVSDIKKQQDGSVWVSSQDKGLIFIYNYQLKSRKLNEIIHPTVTAICKDENNVIYYGCKMGQIIKIDKDGDHELIFENNSAVVNLVSLDSTKLSISSFSGKVTKMYTCDNIEITHIFGRGVVYLSDSLSWKIYNRTLEKSINEEVTLEHKGFFLSIYKDQNNIIWVGGIGGLFKIEGDQLINYNRQIGLSERMVVSCIKQGNDGTLIVSTLTNGLFFLQTNGEYGKINLQNYTVNSFSIEEESNSIWLATSKGVIKIDITSDFNYTLKRISFADGLLSDQINVVLVHDDLVYAGTDNGLSIFSKDELLKEQCAPRIYFSEVQLNEEQIPLKENYVLNYDENNIQISFEGIDFRNAGNVKYRFQLKGNDKDYVYANVPYARYSSLEPGDYTFTVSAANEDLIWSRDKQIYFSISAPFWEQAWFILLVISVIVLLVVLYAKRERRRTEDRILNTKKLEEQKRSVIEAQLVALRVQMNPHFTFNALNAIQNTMLNFSLKKALDYMGQFSTLLRRILDNSDKTHIKLSEEIEMLRLYVNIENIRFNNSIQFQIVVDETINDETIKIPTMIIQPFIENAILHGLTAKPEGEKKITVHVKDLKEQLLCIIQDTGIGRVKASKIKQENVFLYQSLGTINVEQRLKLFSKEEEGAISLQIIDCYDQENLPIGTRIELTLNKETVYD